MKHKKILRIFILLLISLFIAPNFQAFAATPIKATPRKKIDAPTQLLRGEKVKVSQKTIQSQLRNKNIDPRYVTVVLKNKTPQLLSKLLRSTASTTPQHLIAHTVNIGKNGRFVTLTVPKNTTLEKFLVKLNNSSDVLLAEPAYTRHIQDWTPDDEFFVQTASPYWQWQLQNRALNRYSIEMPKAWGVMQNVLGPSNTGGLSTIITAVLDTGYAYESRTDTVTGWEYLNQTPCNETANLWVNTDETDSNNVDDDGNGIRDDRNGIRDDRNGVNLIDYYINPTRSTEDGHPNDDYGHGTFASNIIAGNTNNSGCVGGSGAGIAFNTKIMPIKIFDEVGDTTSAIIIDGLDYALDNGADVINMSFGGPTYSAAEEAKINELVAAGVIPVASSGNTGANSPEYPAAYSNVIAVGASTDLGVRSSYSTYGTWLDIVAPVDLTSTGNGFPQYTFDCYFNSSIVDPYGCLDGSYNPIANAFETFSFDFSSGTSFAAPQVSGVVALIKSIRHEYNVNNVMQLLALGTTLYNKLPAKTPELGYGILNAYNTLRRVPTQPKVDGFHHAVEVPRYTH